METLKTQKTKKFNLNQLKEEVKNLAISIGRDYYMVRVESTEFIRNDGKINTTTLFTCYIDGFDFCDAKTPEAAFLKLENQIFKIEHEVEVSYLTA